MNNENEKSGIMIFQDTFDYLMDNDLTEHEFCEIMRSIYQVRWKNQKPDESEMSKNVRLVWKTLKHSIYKSAQNARQYEKNKLKNKFNSIDTSTGEVYSPKDEPMTSDLTIDTLLENEQDGLKFDENKEIETSNDTNIQKENIVEKKADFETNTRLTEYIISRPEGMMRCKQWNNFVNLYPDAEKIQKISGISPLSAVKLYNVLREKEFCVEKK